MIDESDAEGEYWIGKLIALLDTEWVNQQLEQYFQFRSVNSPSQIWSHRSPITSPLVPALFWHKYPGEPSQQKTLEYWYETPNVFLSRLSYQIYLFQDFWDDFDNDTVRDYLVNSLLQDSSLFPRFHHKLMLATHFKLGTELEVIPQFFNPDSGLMDLVLRTRDDEVGFNCVSYYVGEIFGISCDLVQYLAGVFTRLAQDAQRSCQLNLVVRETLDEQDINSIIAMARTDLASQHYWSKRRVHKKFTMRVRELTVEPTGITSETILRLPTASQERRLVVASGFGWSAAEKKYDGLAAVYLSADKARSLIPWLLQQIAQGDVFGSSLEEMGLALHIFGGAGWVVGTENAWTQGEMAKRLTKVFSNNPYVRTMVVSSDSQAYLNQTSYIDPLGIPGELFRFDNPNSAPLWTEYC